MPSNLERFLGEPTPLAEESAVWGDGTLPLSITSYLAEKLPPQETITSVRSLVFRGDAILTVRNPGGVHIFPGGRREEGESFEATLRREIMEETGWTIHSPTLLGFMHFHHLAPNPPGYRFLHLDFVQLVFMAEAGEYDSECRLEGDYEWESSFRTHAEIQKLDLSPGQRLLLDAAVKMRGAKQP